MSLSEQKNRTWARMIHAQRALTENVEQHLKDNHFPPLAWYSVLWVLENTENGYMRLSDLAERLLFARSNTTRLLDRMEKEELIERAVCEEDGRGVYAKLLPKGKKLRLDMWGAYSEAIDIYFGQHLSDEEAKMLEPILERFFEDF